MAESTFHLVVRAKGGTLQREVHINDVHIPDLWHVAMWLGDEGQELAKKMVLECWYLCHDLKRHISEYGGE